MSRKNKESLGGIHSSYHIERKYRSIKSEDDIMDLLKA